MNKGVKTEFDSLCLIEGMHILFWSSQIFIGHTAKIKSSHLYSQIKKLIVRFKAHNELIMAL